jgi:uncharacterized membrane protein
MDERIVLLGFVLVFAGIAVIILGSFLGAKGKSGSASSGGFAVGGFIGPIPFGWATEKPLLYAVIAISVVMFLAFMVLGRVNLLK